MAVDPGSGFEQYRCANRRDAFLEKTEQIVPWSAVCALIEPHNPKAGKRRPPVGRELMLRMYFYNTDSIWPMTRARKRCWTARRFADSGGRPGL